MSEILSLLSPVLLAIGCFLLFSGGLGLMRFPDFYTRIHATGVCETMGAGFVLLGLMCLAGVGIVLFKLVFILLFLLITCPTSGHVMAKAAQHGGLKPYAEKARAGEVPHDGEG